MEPSWSLSEDLSRVAVGATGAFVVLGLLALGLEIRRRERGAWGIALSGALALAVTAMAVLRPARVTTRGSSVGPRVVVLVDQSRRLRAPVGEPTRAALATRAQADLTRHFRGARLEVLGFGEGEARRLPVGAPAAGAGEATPVESDLVAALEGLAVQATERPAAVVVVSDGRLTRPRAEQAAAAGAALGGPGVPLHTVALATEEPRDASIRRLSTAGAAVAHQALALTVEVGCSGGLDCGAVPVQVRELRAGSAPAVLARGVAQVEAGTGVVELSVTLERAGQRVIEVAIAAPEGDRVAANDTRVVTLSVTRERLRLLHVAGRPTYDVRALRTWLKADGSVDLVAFFILRTNDDNTEADDGELALIPFPVDELFTEHLPSFDAIVLQDIDADRYQLARHLPALAAYVEGGGGLVLVGGPTGFAGGGYAGTEVERVLPVALDRAQVLDGGKFVPRYTAAGRAAPLLRALRDLHGPELPEMVGSNLLGRPRPGALVLWEHPTLQVDGAPMPVLALGEAKDGRALALGVDATHLLAFSEFAAEAAGRGFGALWDGLLGWLMRDPRFEAAAVELVAPCLEGEPARLRVVRALDPRAPVRVALERLAEDPARREVPVPAAPEGAPVEVELGLLAPGGWGAKVWLGDAPPTRFDFACEAGGEAWADLRPDVPRLEALARGSGGRAVGVGEVGRLPLPPEVEVAVERHAVPVVPPWVWTLGAALGLGAHWLARRRGGLA